MNKWQNPGRTVVLASGSPRRKQILEQMGFTFETIIPDSFDENSYLNNNNTEDLLKSIQELASIKAGLVAKQNPDTIVIGADTIVVKDNRVLGKPKDQIDAFNMLRFLSESEHTVITGVALQCIDEDFFETTVCCTKVFFRKIPDIEIEYYLSLNEFKDKAGSYAIQGHAMVFVDKIVGCYYNVVGLPVTSTINLFNDFIARKESADV